MASLKRLFRLDEMALNVPDKNVKDLRRLVMNAIASDELPDDALSWFTQGSAAKAAEPAKAKGKKDKKKADADEEEEERPEPPPVPTPQGGGKADQKKAQSAWDTMASRTFNADDYAPAAGLAEPKSANFQTYKAPKAGKKQKPGQAPPPTQGSFDATYSDPNYEPGQGNVAGRIDPKTGQLMPRKATDVPDWARDPAPTAQPKKKGTLSRMFGKSDAPKKDEPAAMQPKRGALSRLFGPKAVKANPADDQGGMIGQSNPVANAQPDTSAITGPEPVKKVPAPQGPAWTPGPDLTGKGSGADALAQMRKDLGNAPMAGPPPAQYQTVLDPGEDAMNNLSWQLHGKGKSAKKGKKK